MDFDVRTFKILVSAKKGLFRSHKRTEWRYAKESLAPEKMLVWKRIVLVQRRSDQQFNTSLSFSFVTRKIISSLEFSGTNLILKNLPVWTRELNQF